MKNIINNFGTVQNVLVRNVLGSTLYNSKLYLVQIESLAVS